MIVSYHNHTLISDGTTTLEEMIAGARRLGVDELGISDHFALFPDRHVVNWAMPLDGLADYVAMVEQARTATDGLTLRLGLEVDYLAESLDELRPQLAQYDFDFLIGSVHFVGVTPHYFPIDFDAEPWEVLTVAERNDVWRCYWQAIREVAESGFCDFIGHLDLPKKFGYFATVDYTAEITAALDAIAAAGMAIELNTAGWNKPVAEAYPNLALLRAAHRRDIPLVINADAHSPGDITAHFDRARALACEAGYTETLGFARRKRFTVPL